MSKLIPCNWKRCRAKITKSSVLCDTHMSLAITSLMRLGAFKVMR